MSKVFNMVGGGGGPAASIFVTGLSETDTVTATKGSKTLTGKWVTKSKFGKIPLIPTMTSNTEPSGEAGFSGGITSSQNPAYYAFDGDDSTFAYGTTSNSPRGVQYKFDTEKVLTSVYIHWDSWTAEATGTFAFQTSLDGSTWVTHDTESIYLTYSTDIERTFILDNVSALYIRYVVTNMTSNSSGIPNFMTMQAYSDGEIQVSGFEVSPIREFGTWTVTATDGVYTKTQDVLVDVITEYEIEITKKLYLYRNGDECEDVTGGWIGSSGSQSSFTLTKNSDNIEGKNSYCETGDIARFGTTNTINLTGYSKMFIRHDYGGTASKFRVGYKIGATALKPTTNLLQTSNLPNSSSSNINVLTEIDLSYDGDYCFVVTLDSGNVGETVYDKIYEIWLE